MELNNEFEVSAPIDKAWVVLTDVERIAPCLPGAQLQEVEGEEYRGIVKVKVGPITAQYKGAAVFVERDDANHRAVLKADGRDTRGAGNASAFITAQLEPVGDRTKVSVKTDLTVTGKVAQFGRGVMADVSAKLMGQFANNLETMLEADAGTGGAGAGGSSAPTPGPSAAPAEAPSAAAVASAPAAVTTAVAGRESSQSSNGFTSGSAAMVRKIDSPEPQAVDLLDTAGAPVLKRLLPVIGVIVGLLVVRRALRRRRS